MKTTIIIICDKCDHLIRYHEKSSGACITPNCNCKKMEPVEKIIPEDQQPDIYGIDPKTKKAIEVYFKDGKQFAR